MKPNLNLVQHVFDHPSAVMADDLLMSSRYGILPWMREALFTHRSTYNGCKFCMVHHHEMVHLWMQELHGDPALAQEVIECTGRMQEAAFLAHDLTKIRITSNHIIDNLSEIDGMKELFEEMGISKSANSKTLAQIAEIVTPSGDISDTGSYYLLSYIMGLIPDPAHKFGSQIAHMRAGCNCNQAISFAYDQLLILGFDPYAVFLEILKIATFADMMNAKVIGFVEEEMEDKQEAMLHYKAMAEKSMAGIFELKSYKQPSQG